MLPIVWELSHHGDEKARLLADRHYYRKKPGSRLFMPPGRKLVLYAKTDTGEAVWGTLYPKYVQHEWPGAWICALFRNEGAYIASELIVQALAVTRHFFGEPPSKGMITFINREKVKPVIVRGRKTWGRTYELAGFRHVGFTKTNKLMVFQILPNDMPKPQKPKLTY